MNLPGDPQVAAFLSSAANDDCLLGYETDPEKADALRRQGQLEALKGTMLTAMRAPNTESLKTRIVAASDVKTAIGYFSLLKMTGTFSEADIKKLDETFPHLQIADALHNYAQPASPR